MGAQDEVSAGIHGGMTNVNTIHGNNSGQKMLAPVEGDDYHVNLSL